jgi:hypothetical protein
MNFNFGEVLARAWQITWKNKVLWIIGVLFGLFVALMFPLMFLSFLFPVFARESRMDLVLAALVGFIAIFALFMLILYPVSVFTQTSLTLGVLNVEQDQERFSVRELLRRSVPFFWRVLGVMLLFAAGMMLIVLIIQAVMLLVTMITFGFGALCVTPLSLVMYPAMYAAIVWMEQAMNGVIIDNMPLRDAIRQGWNLVRNNLLPVAILALIIYFGIGVVTGVILVPLMIPLFMMPIGFMEHEVNWILVSISIVCVVAFIPLFAFLTGWSMIFTKSAWVSTYLRLTRHPVASQMVSQEAAG